MKNTKPYHPKVVADEINHHLGEFAVTSFHIHEMNMKDHVTRIFNADKSKSITLVNRLSTWKHQSFTKLTLNSYNSKGGKRKPSFVTFN